MNPPGLGFICCLILGIVLLCPAIALLLPSAGLVALLAAVRFYLLVQGDIRVLMSGITMRQMPGAAVFAPIHPQLRSAFDKALVGGMLRLGLVMVHDLVRGGTAFRSEIMHSNTTV